MTLLPAHESPRLEARLMNWAWRTPLGIRSDMIWSRLLSGERALQANARFDARHYACQLAATIASEPQVQRQQRFLRRMGRFALDVAQEALQESGLPSGDRLGLFFGYGGLRAHWEDLMPAFAQQNEAGEAIWQNGFKLLHPFWMLQHLSNNAHALTAELLGARGEGVTYAGGNAGTQALAGAIQALAEGAVDVALVVAYDSLVEPETLVEMAARGLLNTTMPDQLSTLAAPYDKAANGFTPGEAALALVLQRPSATEKKGDLRVSAMTQADGSDCEADIARLAPLPDTWLHEVDLVDGAGRARLAVDNAERAWLAAQTGADMKLSCCQSAFGQVGAAASLLQAVVLAESLRRQCLLPVAGLREPAAGPLRPVVSASKNALRAALGIALSSPGLAGIVRVEMT